MSRLTIDHIPKHVLKDKLTLTIDWVKMSFTVHDNAGSAAWYHILKGWESPYPETTGYLIPTMLSAGEFLDDADLRNLAVAQGSWLAGLQMPSGAFPGGLSPKGSPIVFDCGQILFGLLALHALDNTESMESVIIALCRWLYSTVSDERAWKEMCFLPGYIPAYDTRVIWSLLEARRAGLISFQDEWAIDRIGFLLHDTQPDYWNDRYGFAPGKAAYTHTIAYTLRGILESAELLGEATLMKDACRMMDQIIATGEQAGGIAGAYTAGWKGDKSFIV